MTDFRLENVPHCPNCLETLSGALNPNDDAAPRDGDLTVCVYCGACLVFGPGLTLRALTPTELLNLPDSVRGELLKQQSVVRQGAQLR